MAALSDFGALWKTGQEVHRSIIQQQNRNHRNQNSRIAQINQRSRTHKLNHTKGYTSSIEGEQAKWRIAAIWW